MTRALHDGPPGAERSGATYTVLERRTLPHRSAPRAMYFYRAIWRSGAQIAKLYISSLCPHSFIHPNTISDRTRAIARPTMPFTTITQVGHPLKQLEMFKQFGSKPIRFVVGKEKEEFYLHPNLLSRISSLLDALVRDSTRGSSPSCIDWENVNRSVFLRFAEFAYTGNYSGEIPTEPDVVSPRPLKEYSSDAFALPYSLTSYNSAARDWRGMFDTCPHEGGGVARRFDYARCDCGPSEATKHHISTFLSQYCRSVDISPNIARRQGTGPVEHLICHVQCGLSQTSTLWTR
ncbi:hypothetical protein F5B17DRAFT_424422 [Nemania serpens]|nr:hypothetical protein F5B17DRAFT_424422 [Nemania serpens]